MRILKTGNITYGNSHADMINKVLGTSFQSYRKSSIDLGQFGNDGIIAWFVYMDGTRHGTEENYVWENFLSADENIIKEFSVGETQEKVIRKRRQEGFKPFRLAFQLDPFRNGNRHCCKFIGAFCLNNFLRKDQTAIEYKRIAKEFNLGSKGETGQFLGNRDLFIKHIPNYYTPIEKMDFPFGLYQFLKKNGFHYAGELLELGFEDRSELIQPIQNKLGAVFSKKYFQETEKMTNEQAWKIFNEILVENGDPFETKQIGTNICVAHNTGQTKSIEIMLDAKKGLIIIGNSKQGPWKQACFNSEDKEDFIACAEEIIFETAQWLKKEGVIHRGEIFYARTNAELLNKVLGKNMKGYMKCIYPLTDTSVLLMHTFDRVTTAGWLNREMPNGTVVEQFVGNKKIYATHEGLPNQRYRILFEKRKDEGQFIFKGVYKLAEESTSNKRVWEKIADETNLFDY